MSDMELTLEMVNFMRDMLLKHRIISIVLNVSTDDTKCDELFKWLQEQDIRIVRDTLGISR